MCTISLCTAVKYTCLTASKRLRATGTSRLYQNGLPEKLIMEEVPAPVEVWHNVEAAGIVKRQLHFKDFRGFTVTS